MVASTAAQHRALVAQRQAADATDIVLRREHAALAAPFEQRSFALQTELDKERTQTQAVKATLNGFKRQLEARDRDFEANNKELIAEVAHTTLSWRQAQDNLAAEHARLQQLIATMHASMQHAHSNSSGPETSPNPASNASVPGSVATGTSASSAVTVSGPAAPAATARTTLPQPPPQPVPPRGVAPPNTARGVPIKKR